MAKKTWCVCVYPHNMGYYSYKNKILFFITHKKKNEMLPFVTTWMDLENIMLSEVSQRKTNTVCYYLYVESKK